MEIEIKSNLKNHSYCITSLKSSEKVIKDLKRMLEKALLVRKTFEEFEEIENKYKENGQ